MGGRCRRVVLFDVGHIGRVRSMGDQTILGFALGVRTVTNVELFSKFLQHYQSTPEFELVSKRLRDEALRWLWEHGTRPDEYYPERHPLSYE